MSYPPLNNVLNFAKALLLLILICSCSQWINQEKEDRIIAKVYDKTLKNSELAGKIPDGLAERDSVTLAENYIANWIQNEILVYNAKNILNDSEQNFTQQLNEYRNSLLLYMLEQKLVGLYLDTVVTDQEIDSYYAENSNNFELKGDIVKFDFIKINRKSKNARNFRKLLNSDNPDDLIELVEQAEKNAEDYWFAREWVAFDELLNEIPIEVDNQALFLRRNQFIETEDDEFLYMARINDYKTANSIPPLEFEKDKIRNIILNARKINLIEQKRQELIDKAFESDNAKIY